MLRTGHFPAGHAVAEPVAPLWFCADRPPDAAARGVAFGAMGFEYKIRFKVPPAFSHERLVRQLPDPAIPSSSWLEYEYRLEADGFYFIDNGKSAVASIAFRQLVDEALRHGDRVEIEEL
jgi:hypothetical protein